MSQPDPVDDFAVHVEDSDRGWLVVSVADGERTELGDPHPDRESAEFYAKSVASGAELWDGAAEMNE